MEAVVEAEAEAAAVATVVVGLVAFELVVLADAILVLELFDRPVEEGVTGSVNLSLALASLRMPTKDGKRGTPPSDNS